MLCFCVCELRDLRHSGGALIRWDRYRRQVLGGDVGSLAGMDWTILKTIKLYCTQINVKVAVNWETIYVAT